MGDGEQIPLHDTIAAAYVKAAVAMGPHQREADADARTVWFDSIEQTLRGHVTPLLQPLLDHPDMPQEIKNIIGIAVDPQQANELTVVLMIVGALLFPLVQAFFAPASLLVAQKAFELPGNAVVPLSPAEAAAAVIKGIDPNRDWAAVAQKSGMDSGPFADLVNISGQAIGIESAISLWRQNKIDATELQRVVYYSNVRSDFLDDIKALRYDPVSIGAVISGVLKGHLDKDVGRTMAGAAGLAPLEYDWMLATAGRPYGIEQALQLWNRGVIDQARVEAVIAQSDVNNAFTPDILALKVYLPPPRSVVPMLRSGAITEARALQLLEMHGLQPQDAQAFVTEAKTTKTSAAKDLTASQVVSMFEAGFITQGDAQTRLVSAGHPAADVTLLLDFAAQSRKTKLTNALISKAGTLYVGHKIDKTEASTMLNGDAVPANVQADLFHVWDLERAAIVHTPTASQVVGAFRRQIITPLVTRTRLTDLGVSVADMPIVVADGFPPTTGKAEILAMVQAVLAGATTFPGPGAGAPKVKDLTRADLTKEFQAKIITEAQFRAGLITLGYDGAEADQIIALAKL